MPFFTRTHWVVVLLVSCLAATLRCYAQPAAAPVYARQRGIYATGEGAGGAGSQVWGAQHGSHRFAGTYPGYYRGYLPYQHVTTGSWYARPYPYHFDYYRQRYRASPQAPDDSPCAATPAPY